jgi:hypothetical protein
MKKFVVMSVMLATFVIPLLIARRQPDLARGVRLVQKRFLVFMTIYVVTVLYILPRL